jgi:hypothetical protein
MLLSEEPNFMAKPKPSKGPAPTRITKDDLKVAVPCLVLIVGAIVLLGLLFSAVLKPR